MAAAAVGAGGPARSAVVLGPAVLLGAAALAAAVVVTLFIIMRYLIMTDAQEPEAEREAVNIEITSDRGESTVIRREDRPREPDEVKAPPPPPRIEAAKAEQPAEGLASILGALPDINPDAVNSDTINFVVADRDEQPLVRIPPQFPPRAAERGIEGLCHMRFDVLADGTIDETSIVADCDSSLFVREASRAVARWKYAPKIVNGEPVVRRGVQTDLEFKFEE